MTNVLVKQKVLLAFCSFLFLSTKDYDLHILEQFFYTFVSFSSILSKIPLCCRFSHQFYYIHSLFPDPSMLGTVCLLNQIGLPLPTVSDVGDGKINC